jgi:hypothetical protein
MNHRKRPERRTFLQDRFEILIKRQKTGVATFNELTELDEIVNREPEIRNRIIRESMLMEGMDDFNEPANDMELETIPFIKLSWRQSLINRIKSLIAKIFTAQISIVRSGNLIMVS